MPQARQLVGRDRELSALIGLLDHRDDLPAAALLEGEAGIGKTTIWHAVVEAARDRSYRVLAARPVVAESPLAFTSLADLLEDALDDVLASLPEPQQWALEAALLRRPAEGGSLDPRAIGQAFLGALRTLASRSPVLLAIDDIQWLDRASATVVGFAARRLQREPVAVLLAHRTSPEGGEPHDLEIGLQTTIVSMAPLSLGAIHALVYERLGAVVPRPRLRRLHELSRGNPYYALEIARAWQAGALQLEAGEPLPMRLVDLVGARIAALPSRARRTVALAAALSRPTVGLLERAEGLGSRASISRATSAGIVELHGDDVRFAHPLLAASAYGGVSASERRDIHAVLATLDLPEDERARHLGLAATDPDEAVAAQLEHAARGVFQRGAPAAAAELAALGVRLTPGYRPAERTRRSLEEAEYRFEAGETAAAADVLAELVAEAPPGQERAALLARQARFRHFGDNVRGGVELLRQALVEAGDDARLRAGIEEGLAWGLLLVREDLPGAEAHARNAVRCAEQIGDESALAEALAALALTQFLMGEDSAETMARALALEPATLHLRVLRHPSFAYGYVLNASDQLGRAQEVFGILRGRAEEHGDESALPPILSHMSVIACLAGEWDESERLAEDAYQVALQNGQIPSQAAALGRLALVQALRGRPIAGSTAERSLALAVGPGFSLSDVPRAVERGGEMALWALGLDALGRDDPAAAHGALGPMCSILIAAGIREPGELRPLPDEIEALVGLGRLDEAAELVGLLDAMAAHVGRPSTRASAGRSRAILLGAQGDVGGAVEAAQRARVDAEEAGMPFETARTLLVLGASGRRARQKRSARESLEAAVAILEGLGARPWVERARAELRRIGGRAPGTGDLTPTERRAAELVADGLSNKEVAAALFVSPRTVEANLSRVYMKLGVRSRTELVRALSSDPSGSKDEGLP